MLGLLLSEAMYRRVFAEENATTGRVAMVYYDTSRHNYCVPNSNPPQEWPHYDKDEKDDAIEYARRRAAMMHSRFGEL